MSAPGFPPRRRQFSAALVLGLVSGCIAAIAVLPTAFPLVFQLQTVEQDAAIKRTDVAVRVIRKDLEERGTLQPGYATRLDVTHVHVTKAGMVEQEGPDMPAPLAREVCASLQPTSMTIGATTWTAACSKDGDREIVAALAREGTSSLRAFGIVALLAVVVGIVTALGVLRLLSPLSRMSGAMTRVAAGERGVRLRTTGLRELDQLVDQLNAAASAVEMREESILSRIQAVQEMARMVAHEVRNPLQSLELLTSLIASEEDPLERQQLADAIHAEIRGLDLVVHRVLKEGVARGSQGMKLEKSPQPFAPIVDHILAMRKLEADKHGIKLERGPVADVAVPVDGALIGRSIENLIINAMQFVPPRKGLVRVSVLGDDGRVRIVVDDNGRGVDPALGSHVFEPNVSGRTGGTGLGLALVKQVVDAHGGTVTYGKSDLGGASFVIELPKAAPLG